MRMILAFLILVASFSPSLAHGPAKGPNGGQLRDAGTYHLELAIRGDEVLLYVSDGDDRPLDIAGAKASAVLVATGRNETLSLAAQSGNRMTARAGSPIPANARIAVTLTMPGKAPVSARFQMEAP